MIDYTKLFDTLYFKKIKQSHLAEELNISRSYISRIEKKALEILKEKIKENKIYEED